MSNCYSFWVGFEKNAANVAAMFGSIGKALKAGTNKIKSTAGLPKPKPAGMPVPAPKPAGVPAATPKPAPAAAATPTPKENVVDYAKLNAEELARKRPANPAELRYGAGGKIDYIPPGQTKPATPNSGVYQQKAKARSQRQIQNAMKGGHTDPQFKRAL